MCTDDTLFLLDPLTWSLLLTPLLGRDFLGSTGSDNVSSTQLACGCPSKLWIAAHFPGGLT